MPVSSTVKPPSLALAILLQSSLNVTVICVSLSLAALTRVGVILSYNVFTPVVCPADTAFPASSYMDAPSADVISMVSSPDGVPVTVRNTLIVVSPPVKAEARPSSALSFCVMELITAPVAVPPLCVKVRASLSAVKAAAPSSAPYTPSSNVTSI